MSGFAGCVSSSTGSVALAAERDRLLRSLRIRAGRLVFHTSDSSVVVECRNSLSSGPRQEIQIAKHGRRIIAGDLRLDNRRELISELNLRNDQQTTDQQIVLQAFEHWGMEFLRHLTGDYAFGIWCGEERSLLLVRDRLGVRPLFYKQSRQTFLFGSEAKFIAPEVWKHADEKTIANFLVGMTHLPEEIGSTGIRRLPAGHILKWSGGAVGVEEYWRLLPGRKVVPNPSRQFREKLTNAVSCRLGGADTTGCMLSGGLDSSAVSLIARDLTKNSCTDGLPTYSFVFNDSEELDERRYIEAVLETGGFNARLIEADRFPPLENIEARLEEQDGFFLAAGLPRNHRLYEIAAGDNISVLLDGHGGDEVVGHGLGRLLELARKGKYLSMALLLPAACKLIDQNPLQTFFEVLERSGGNSRRNIIARRIARRINCYGFSQQSDATDSGPAEVLNEDVLALVEEESAHPKHLSSEEFNWIEEDLAAQLLSLSSPLSQHAFEVLDRSSSRHGISARFPFFDLRLVELCMSLPSNEKLRRGQTRSILRRALKSRFPREVLNRADKTDFRLDIAKGLVNHHNDILDSLLSDGQQTIGKFVKLSSLKDRVATLRDSPENSAGEDVGLVLRSAIAHVWFCAGGSVA